MGYDLEWRVWKWLTARIVSADYINVLGEMYVGLLRQGALDLKLREM